MYTYGDFQETNMVLFTICFMIILNPKQVPGSSVSYLQNSTQILNMMEISAVLGNGCFSFFLPLSYFPPQSHCFVHLLLLVPWLTLQNEFILNTSPMSLCRGEYPCQVSRNFKTTVA